MTGFQTEKKINTISAKLHLQQDYIVVMKNVHHGLLQFWVLSGVFWCLFYFCFLGHGFSIIYGNSFRTALES